MASLQDQLLKAGLVDKKKSQKIEKEKRKKARQTPKGQKPVDESKAQAIKAQQEKADRDREINKQRNQEQQAKALQAQIKQLVDVNKIDRSAGELSFQFADNKKIKKIYVTPLLQEQLSKGIIAIVKAAEEYELVPAVIAEKIQSRDCDCVLFLAEKNSQQLAEDDPYADYQIPDDLMW